MRFAEAPHQPPCLAGRGGVRVVVTEDARQLPAPVGLEFPQLEELRRLGHLIRLAGREAVEPVQAGLDGAIALERMDLEAAFDQLAARPVVDALGLALALLAYQVHE